MNGSRKAAFGLAGVALVVLALSQSVSASTGPKWSAAQLTAFSDVVVTGRVEALAAGWDPAVNTIYTYVTIDVDELFKGALGQERIIIKQLGGVVGNMGLAVADQPTFTTGERVLLYLEARPRDGSLYTAALWQGKWNLETDAFGNDVAVRLEPSHGNLGVTDRLSIADVRAAGAADARPANRVNVAPAEAATAIAQPFALLGNMRYLHVPAVNVQSGGQSGLSGGGLTEIATAIAMWNAAGTGTRLSGGSASAAPRCSTQQLGDSNVSIAFDDPCGEISDSGGTLAIGGSYYFNGGGGTSNGVNWNRAAEGFVVNNDSQVALGLLRTNTCFQDIQLHELGHVLGLGHTSVNGAIMFPTVNNNCGSGATSLAADDVSGLVFIYGGSGGGGTTPPSSAPGNVTVIVNGTSSITVSWTAVTAFSAVAPSAATSYRLDFRQTVGGPVLASVPSSATTINIPLPPGTAGTFNVTVTPLNGAGAGPASSPTSFTIGGGGGGCTAAPAAVTNVTGGVTNGVAAVTWAASAGATAYFVQAGSTQGSANLFPQTNIGNNTGASSPVPPGFQAWVGITAVNACGQSARVDFFLQ